MTPIESIQEVDGKEIDPKEQKPKEGVSVNRMSDIPDSRGDFPVSTTTFTCKSFPGWMPLESEDFDEEVIDAGHADPSDNSIALENENREVKRLESNLQSQVT